MLSIKIMSQKITKKYSDIDPKKMSFTDFEENSRAKGQKIAYVRYSDSAQGESTLVMQTPWITLNTYGIPRAGEYYKDENSRSFMKVPLDIQDECIKILHMKMGELDTILSEDETKKNIFGSSKIAKQYQYQPIIRVPPLQDIIDETDDSYDDNDKKTVYSKPPYMKAKFHLDYETGNMKTKLYKRTMSEDDSVRRDEISIKTLKDVEKYVTFNSKVRLIMMPNKLWALRTYNGNKYGMTWKIMQMEFEEASRKSMKDIFGTDAFLDSDSDTVLTTVPTTVSKKVIQKLDIKKHYQDIVKNEESEGEGESESESMISKTVSKKT